MHVYSDGTDWYVAESALDACHQQEELAGNDDASPEDEWEQLADDTTDFTIHDFDGTGVAKTQSIREWIAENGRGLLCSTEW